MRTPRPVTEVPRTVPPGVARRTLAVVRRFRTNFVFGALLVLFGGLLFRCVVLQVAHGAEYRERAAREQMRSLQKRSVRGAIRDRHGRALAQSRPVRTVGLDAGRPAKDAPFLIRDPARFAATLADILDQPGEAKAIRDAIRRAREERLTKDTRALYCTVHRNLDDPRVIARLDAAMAERSLPGLVVVESEIRDYPNGLHAAHVLGRAGLGDPPEGPLHGGAYGMEARLDRFLRGEARAVPVARDGRGRAFTPDRSLERAGDPSRDAYLTIDLVVQHACESALDRLGVEWTHDGAVAIVLDPANGDVLGMAVRPTFDPNDPATPILANLAVQERYEPGSTFKAFTAAWALEHGVVSPDEVLPMPLVREFELDGRVRRVSDDHEIGDGTLRTAVAKSSNTAHAELGWRLGPRRLQALVDVLGVRVPTGDQFPREIGGIVASPETWNPLYTTTSVGFGHELSVTPLRLAACFAAFARADFAPIQPRVVLALGAQSARAAVPGRPLLSDPAHRALVRDALAAVVDEGTGSATVKSDRFRIAGKTGTAKVPRGGGRFSYVSSFCGYAPASAPRIVVLVLAKDPESPRPGVKPYGALVAGPAVRSIVEDTLDYFRVAPDGPALSAAGREAVRDARAPADAPASLPQDLEEAPPMKTVASAPTTAAALRRLLADALGDVRFAGVPPRDAVRGLSDDSREVHAGDAFFARAGTKADGLTFARAAMAAGASVVVARELVASDVPTIVVPDVEAAIRLAADAWYDRPQSSLDLVGVTGTKGKTTTTYLVRAALAAAARPCAVLGTIAYDVGDGRPRPAGNTTPGGLALRRLLSDARDAGAVACAMEVSSHALDQGRTLGIPFRAGVLTNLASDHLDYHETPGAYFEAKARLFSGLSRGATAVINRDDPAWARFAALVRGRVVTYGTSPEADLRAKDVELAADGTSFRLAVAGEGEFDVRTPLVGQHNVGNFLAAVGAAAALGVEPYVAAEGASAVAGIRGRLERVLPSADLHAFVDYAHTEDALRQVLGFLRAVGALPLVCVFGCGGDRDRTKRPRMGRVAAELSDRVVLTSDNPRTEDPAAILDEVLAGVPEALAPKVSVVADRREAIRLAVLDAPPGASVLVAGKGHEDYQILGTAKVPFDDATEARTALALRAQMHGVRRPA
jgi:UDP-N-acetylmuramoyl-L-alanyl-D-glutamate--2,6-diaminopimelate ligase